ncbi:thioredoxin family protein [Akkermansia muciniphila]|uniref:thioredoxin family protein n=1 Tax=Akkermansia muciniphila TaxID=239935 RepID=UPI001C05FABA|nr:thioredoxin family protein [Akkermansia muciniphila]QWP31926.1 thioredoxin family protein [Akkermansia muciniphila]
MIRQILPVVVAACVAPCFAAEGWITDMDAAKKQAAEQKKDLMIEFTGSDWCPPCMQLRANVFSKPDFQKEAQKKFRSGGAGLSARQGAVQGNESRQ